MVITDGNAKRVKQVILFNTYRDDCTITSTLSSRRSFDVPPLSPVTDHDFVDADMTNSDRDI